MLWYFSYQGVCYLNLIKFDEKTDVGRSNGLGERLAYWVNEYSSKAKRFVVEDKKLRHLIESNLVRCFLVIYFCVFACMITACLSVTFYF